MRPLRIATGVLLAAFVSAIASDVADASPARRLLGCWSQTAPFRMDQIPDHKEWYSRTWCFRAGGRLQIWNLACGKYSGCDGWDDDQRYRVRGANLDIKGLHYDERGKINKDFWRRCRPVFGKLRFKTQFVLTNCAYAKEPFVSDKDPERQ